MSSKAELLIHIGLHKTGTTWLQNCLFDNREAGFASPCPRPWLVDEFVTVNSYRFDPEAARARFDEGLQSARGEGLVPVLSSEGLSGKPTTARYYGKEVADRLAAAFPNAKVLIGIREQKSMILSLYNQYRKQPYGHEPLEVFLGTGGAEAGFQPICRLDHFEYDLITAHYQALFGKENVLVLPYEQLRREPDSFAKSIARFAGTTELNRAPREVVNPSFSPLTLELKRRANFYLRKNQTGARQPFLTRVVTKAFYQLDRITPKSVNARIDARMRETIKRHVGDYYKPSNLRTQELTGLRLDEWGYDV